MDTNDQHQIPNQISKSPAARKRLTRAEAEERLDPYMLTYLHKQRWIARMVELDDVLERAGDDAARAEAKQAVQDHYAILSRPETSREALLEEYMAEPHTGPVTIETQTRDYYGE